MVGKLTGQIRETLTHEVFTSELPLSLLQPLSPEGRNKAKLIYLFHPYYPCTFNNYYGAHTQTHAHTHTQHTYLHHQTHNSAVVEPTSPQQVSQFYPLY